jgi:hypothetical protein
MFAHFVIKQLQYLFLPRIGEPTVKHLFYKAFKNSKEDSYMINQYYKNGSLIFAAITLALMSNWEM